MNPVPFSLLVRVGMGNIVGKQSIRVRCSHAHIHTHGDPDQPPVVTAAPPAALRSLHLHFGTSFQRLKFFPGASRDDLLAGIREVMGAAADAPLRFRDAEGDVVLVSSSMPSGSVLHVEIEQGVPFDGVHAPPAQALATPAQAQAALAPSPQAQAPPPLEWRCWAKAEGGVLDGCKFTCVDVSKTWAAYTPPIPTTGKHYFVIDFVNRPCCASIGLIPGTLASLPKCARFSEDPAYPFMVALGAAGTGKDPRFCSSSAWSAGGTVGVYLDMDMRLMSLVSHADPRNASLTICMDSIPAGPWVFVIYGPKHDICATIRPCKLPDGGVCIPEPSRRLVKAAARRPS